MKVRFKAVTENIYVCPTFTALPGNIIEVSVAKGNQLLTDFPKDWEEVGVEPETPPSSVLAPEAEEIKPESDPDPSQPRSPAEGYGGLAPKALLSAPKLAETQIITEKKSPKAPRGRPRKTSGQKKR